MSESFAGFGADAVPTYMPKKPGHCCGYDGIVRGDPSDPKPNHSKHNSTEPTPDPYSRNGSIFGSKPEG